MTRPWFGVTPPPRGQGYYPYEDDLPAYFAPKPVTPGFTFYDPETPGAQANLDRMVQEEVTRQMVNFYSTVDATLLDKIAEHMRDRGWTVTPPEEVKP